MNWGGADTYHASGFKGALMQHPPSRYYVPDTGV